MLTAISPLRASVPVSTYGELLQALMQLSPEQLGMSLSVTAGCDANGNAEFLTVSSLTCAGDPALLAASDGVLEPEQPVLIFDEEDREQEVPDTRCMDPLLDALPAPEDTPTPEQLSRAAAQYELATGRNGAAARRILVAHGVTIGLLFISRMHKVDIQLGPWLLCNKAEAGYWCNNFGWSTSKFAASGFEGISADLPPSEALRMIDPRSSWVRFEDAVDFSLDDDIAG